MSFGAECGYASVTQDTNANTSTNKIKSGGEERTMTRTKPQAAANRCIRGVLRWDQMSVDLHSARPGLSRTDLSHLSEAEQDALTEDLLFAELKKLKEARAARSVPY